MKLGADPKKVAILAVLLLVAGYFVITNMFSGSTPQSTSSAARARTEIPPEIGRPAPRPEVRKTTLVQAAGVPAVLEAAQTGGERRLEFHRCHLAAGPAGETAGREGAGRRAQPVRLRFGAGGKARAEGDSQADLHGPAAATAPSCHRWRRRRHGLR